MFFSADKINDVLIRNTTIAGADATPVVKIGSVENNLSACKSAAGAAVGSSNQEFKLGVLFL